MTNHDHNIPTNLRYTKTHEWIEETGDSLRVGISDYAQAQLGDAVFIDLPQENLRVEKGDVLATIESVKAANEIYAPVSGTVSQVNEQLMDSPELLNSDPYGEGFIVKISVETPDELQTLMSSEDYRQTLDES